MLSALRPIARRPVRFAALGGVVALTGLIATLLSGVMTLLWVAGAGSVLIVAVIIIWLAAINSKLDQLRQSVEAARQACEAATRAELARLSTELAQANERAQVVETDLSQRLADQLDTIAILQAAMAPTFEGMPGLPDHFAGGVFAGAVQLGEFTKALKWLEQTPNSRPPEPAALRRFGRALIRRGFLGPGIEVLSELCERHPGDPGKVELAAAERRLAALSSIGPHPVLPPSEPFDPIGGRVLHLTGWTLPTRLNGYTVRTHHIAAAQRAAGLEAAVVAPGRAGLTASSSVLDEVPYTTLAGPDNPGAMLRDWFEAYVAQLAEHVASWRPAVLHAASDFINAWAALSVGQAFGIPVIYECRGFWEETWLDQIDSLHGKAGLGQLTERYGPPDEYLIRQRSEIAARRAADAVVVLSPAMARQIHGQQGEIERLVVVNNAVDARVYHDSSTRPDSSERRQLVESLGWPAEAVVVGVVSSLLEYEGIDGLLRAFAQLAAAERPELRLLIVGDGGHRPTLEQLAGKLELGASASFAGQVPYDRVPAYLELIDIFVVARINTRPTSLVTPLKPYEAMAAGKAVLLSDLPPLRDLAEESGAAALFSAGDVDDLARALAELADDGARREQLGQAARRWVLKERTWTVMVERYRELYRSCGVKL